MAQGGLRVYLGAAPGVGKTVAMLAEGKDLQAQGTDVVIGLLETHGRQFTRQMSQGLEMVPRRRLRHSGTVLYELDMDGVIARAPEVVLIDELAHTNAEGSAHVKRWQDVQQIRDAGITVITTLNIQHLESLNDAVEEITGIAQQETVPDQLVRSADQIELVDLTPQGLRQRMVQGNIYRPERVDAALSNYFRVGNLTALRELALLWLADRVDEGLAAYRETQAIEQTWPTRERVIVAVSGGKESASLLRRGARIASRGAGGELLAVHVSEPSGMRDTSLPQLARYQQMVEELGGTYHAVFGEDISTAVLEFARSVNATQVVVGTSRRRRFSRFLRPSVSTRITAKADDIDVHVVGVRKKPRFMVPVNRSSLPFRRKLAGWILAVAGPALLTAVFSFFPVDLQLPLQIVIFMAVSVMVALIGGRWPAILGAVVSSLLTNWFFTDPTHTFTISSPQNTVTLIIFVAVASAVASVVDSLAVRTNQAMRAQAESSALLELSTLMLSTTNQLGELVSRAPDMFGARQAAIVYRPDERSAWQVVESTPDFDINDAHAVKEPIDDEHQLVLTTDGIHSDQQRLLSAFASHAKAVLIQRGLRKTAAQADNLERDNKTRTALLSAVGHDLRTPLAGIKAAASSLLQPQVSFSKEDETELLRAIDYSADRLEALIGNLLDMSRIQVGALSVHPELVSVAEILEGTIPTLSRPIQWDPQEASVIAFADPGLLDRVIANLCENALRYSPKTKPVRILVTHTLSRVEIRVVDRGPGIKDKNFEQIFQPFQRFTDVPDQNGLGLGLAVAKGLTEGMNGTLEAEETPGGGLTMVISLPAQSDNGGQQAVAIQLEDPGRLGHLAQPNETAKPDRAAGLARKAGQSGQQEVK